MNYAGAFEDFLRLSTAEGAASLRTIKAYREHLASFVAWAQGAGISPTAASRLQLEEYRAHLIAKGYARATIQARLTGARILFRALQRAGLRLDNPADGLKAPRPDAAAPDKVLAKALSVEEARRLLVYASSLSGWAGARDRAIIAMMMLQGLRAEELCTLHLRDLDLESFAWLTIHGKGGKERRAILARGARRALIDWRNYSSRSLEPEPFLFRNERGGRLSVRTLERITNRHLEAAGLKRPGHSCHSLRHTFGVLAVLGGAEREILRDALGHASSRTTDLYTAAAARYQGNPAAAVQAALEASTSKAESPADNSGPRLLTDAS